MEVANDLLELQELISRLGLKDDRRQSPRYKVEIPANYYIEQGSLRGSQGKCCLVDVSRKGVSIKVENITFQEGEILHLRFQTESNQVDVFGKTVRIDREEDEYLVRIQSTNENTDIVNQLFSK